MEYNVKVALTKLVGSNGTASFLAFMLTPFITRLFEPTAFGIASTFAACVSMFGAVSCLRYDQAILVARTNTLSANMVVVSLIIVHLICFIIMTVVFFLGEPLLIKINLSEVDYIFLLFPLSILVVGFYSSLNFWNIRRGIYDYIAAATIISALTSPLLSLGFGTLGYLDGKYLIVASLISQILAVLILLFPFIKPHERDFFKRVRSKTLITGFVRYKNFPIVGSPAILLGASSWTLPTILMAFFFGAELVGLYALGFKMIQIPTRLIGSAIGQVFFDEARKLKSLPNFANLVETTTSHLIKIFIFPFAALTVIGSDLYSLIFGENWQMAGVYTQILAPFAFLWFVSSPLTPIFSILEKQKTQLLWNILNFLTRLAPIFIGAYMQDFNLIIWILGIVGTLLYGHKIYLIFSIAGASITNALRLASAQILICFFAMVLLNYMNKELNNFIFLLIFSVGVSFINIIYGNKSFRRIKKK